MTAASREQLAALVQQPEVDLGLAAALIAVEVHPELDVASTLEVLDVLADDVASPDAEGLRQALGERAGFRGAAEDYEHVRSSLLPDVLLRRRGLPILLSIVWVEVARRLDVPAAPIALPGKVVAQVGTQVVDPFEGGVVLTRRDVDVLVQGVTGGPVQPEHLLPADPPALLLRLLTNVRALAHRQGSTLEAARTQLWAVELSLLLPHHPAELRRERGHLLVRLGDHLGAATELEGWADVVSLTDERAAEQARDMARSARAHLN